MLEPKRKWWMSWFGCWETLGNFELHTPWWFGGDTDEEPERQIVCAAIWAENEDEIKKIINGCYDKRPGLGDIEFRFFEPQPDDWDPRKDLGDRFSWEYWMEPYWQRGEYR